MKLYEFISRHRKAVFFLIAIFTIGGIVSLFLMPIALFPNIDFPRIVMIADNGEEPAERMMIEVTRPLEEAARAIPGVTRVKSATSRGSSEIDINFDWGTDIIQALQLLQGKVSSIRNELPPTVSIDIERMNAAVFPIAGFSLTSDSLDQVQLRDLAYYVVRPALMRVSGIADVVVVGGRQREFLVKINPQRLQSYGLSVSDVSSAIDRTNFVSATGLVERNYQIYLTLVDGLYKGLDDIKNTVVDFRNGMPITVGDVASVEPSEKIEYIRVTADERPAVLVNIVRQPSGNTVEIGKQVRAQLASMKDVIPPSVKMKYFYDQGDFISSSIGSARDSIIVGLLLAILVIFVFLRSFRIGSVAVITVPAVFASAVLFLYIIGNTLNIMTLGGIAAAVGLVIDDNVVMIENIFRHMRYERGSPRQAVAESMREILPAIVGSSLSSIIVFAPFAFLYGVTGAFFKPLAITMAVSLAVSMIYSLTLVPLLAEKFITQKDVELEFSREEKSHHRFSGAYESALKSLLRRSYLGPVFAVIVLGATFLLYSSIGSDFMPHMDEGSFVLDYNSPPGTSLDETNRMLMQVEKIIMSIPEVDSYSRRTGTQLGFFITEPNNGDFLIKLKKNRRRSVFQIIDELRQKVETQEPALIIDFGQAMQDLIGDLTNSPAPVEIKIFGPDQNVIEEKAKEVADIIHDVPGVVDVFNGIVISGPSIVVHPDPVLTARAGFTMAEIQSQLRTIMEGSADTYVLNGEKLIGVRVRYPEQYHSALEDIQNVRLKSPNGFYVPLSNVASVEVLKGQSEVDREDLKLMLPVSARISGRDLGSTITDIKKILQAKLVLPQGVTYSFGGLYQSQQESFRSLLLVLIAAFILVIALMIIEFESLTVPIVLFSTNLTSLFGVLLALVITGITFNISSFVGMIMMVGIVNENGVLIIHMINQIGEKDGYNMNTILRACKVRARPILMTTFAAVFALMPLALGVGAGGQMQQPLAVAVIGGFLLSSFLLLFELPALYVFLRRIK
ncbi:MAG TPA: efflux RND transporter permease subunit [Candidatus Acidoferrales bacterium]|nr:efflux RND transporter permease subunit [Candidatus Acidoferrales bacterium]